MAGEAKTEEQRRARVVHGWAFANHSPELCEAILVYLDGGPCPPEYAAVDKVVK